MSGVRVMFHFNAADPLAYTCRLVMKAIARHTRMVVCASVDQLAVLDQQLWGLGDSLFVPHAPVGAPVHVLQHSPVWLRSELVGDEPQGVLLNMAHAVPSGFERFERLIEVVSSAEADRVAARVRWRAYAAQGISPGTFDAGSIGP